MENICYLIKPKDWEIYTDGTNARKTTDGLNAAISEANSKGYSEVFIPKGTYLIDAISKTSSKPENGGGVRIPSNMKLSMDPEAELKVEPNASYGYSCIYLDNVHNVVITGGMLTGERYEHDFSASDKAKETHEWGFGINVHGGRNILIDNVRIKNFTGDCIFINAQGMIDITEKYIAPERVTVKNCTLDGARRNNISINACDGVVIENNEILNAGIHDGVRPKLGIDIEGYGEGSIDYEIPKNIIIRNNTFRGNMGESICNFSGYEVIIEGNHSDNTISYGNGTDTVIANNVFIRTDNQKTAIGGQKVSQGFDGNNVTIVGNVIKGFSSGIDARGKDVVVDGNTLSHLGDTGVGITAYKAENVLITNNSVHRTKGKSYRIELSKDIHLLNNKAHGSDTCGIESNASSKVILEGNVIRNCSSGILITSRSTEEHDNEVVVSGNHIDLTQYEDKTSYAISFDNKSDVTLKANRIFGPKNIAIYGESMDGRKVKILDNEIADANSFTAMIQIKKGSKHEIVGNIITFNRTANGGHGIYLTGTKDTIVAKNTVYSNSESSLVFAINTSESTGAKVLNNIAIKGALSLNKTDANLGNTVI